MMKESPLVSILMPAFNADKFIAEAVRSILDQDYSNWELLILNDASSDSTQSVIDSFSDDRIRVFKHDLNQGYLHSCNDLFAKARGEFVTFLDADDTCSKDRISVCLEAFNSDDELGFTTTDHVRIGNTGNLISEQRIDVDYSKYASEPNYYPTICCATAFLRKVLLDKVGGYDPFFDGIGGEDYHWLFRLSLNGKGLHLSTLSYCYRRHQDQIHLKNSNPLKYFAKDMDQELRHALIAGIDPLKNASTQKIKWQNHVSKNPSELHLRKASEALNQSESSLFWIEIRKAITYRPFSVYTWQKSAYLIYSHLARKP